jgi:hypothetical protein
MKKVLLVSIPLLLVVGIVAVGVFALPVIAADTVAVFVGGIGVIPVSSGVATAPTLATALNVETVNRNIVRGVQPAGQIWVISKLNAEFKTDGAVKVKGEGLVLGGGNNVGRATGQNVFATLICEAAPGPFTELNSDLVGVPIGTNGNFTIDGVLSAAPPAACASPVLLIRNAANLNWFAAGILK